MNTVNPFETTIPALNRVTDKYRFIPTGEFIRDVEAQGFQCIRKFSPRRGLGMHSMVFRSPNMPSLPGIDFDLLATNSHDASAAFRLWIQLSIGVCTNVLVDGAPMPKARVIHIGYAADKVKAALDAAMGRLQGTIDTVKALQFAEATPELTAAFLTKAVELRHAAAMPYRIIDLTAVRHHEQSTNTAWNVFNRVQEALVKGGYKNIAEHNGQRYPGSRVRALTSIRETVQVNHKLWTLAVETFLPKV